MRQTIATNVYVKVSDDIKKILDHKIAKIGTLTKTDNEPILFYSLAHALASYSHDGAVMFNAKDSHFATRIKIILVKGSYHEESKSLVFDVDDFFVQLANDKHFHAEKIFTPQGIPVIQFIKSIKNHNGISLCAGMDSTNMEILGMLDAALKKYCREDGHVIFTDDDGYLDAWIKLILVNGTYDRIHRAIVFDIDGFYDQLHDHINEDEQNSGLMITGGNE